MFPYLTITRLDHAHIAYSFPWTTSTLFIWDTFSITLQEIRVDNTALCLPLDPPLRFHFIYRSPTSCVYVLWCDSMRSTLQILDLVCADVIPSIRQMSRNIFTWLFFFLRNAVIYNATTIHDTSISPLGTYCTQLEAAE